MTDEMTPEELAANHRCLTEWVRDELGIRTASVTFDCESDVPHRIIVNGTEIARCQRGGSINRMIDDAIAYVSRNGLPKPPSRGCAGGG